MKQEMRENVTGKVVVSYAAGIEEANQLVIVHAALHHNHTSRLVSFVNHHVRK